MILSTAFQGFRLYLVSAGYSPSTIALYEYVFDVVIKFLGDKEVQDITLTDLQAYFAYLQTDYRPARITGKTGKLSGGTLQNHWKGIRSFFNWAEDTLELKRRPDAKLKLPPKNPRSVEPFTEAEVKALLEAAEHTRVSRHGKQYTMRRRTSVRDVALILVLLDTGLRAGELCRLNIADVNLETGRVDVEPFGSRGIKTRSRDVYLGKSARRVLWKYLSTRLAVVPDVPLFVNEHGERMTPNALRNLTVDLGTRVGIEHAHPHRFRHTFAIEFLRNGGDIYSLQGIMGHSTLTMLKTYLQIATGDKLAAHQRASPADKWKL